MLHEVKVNVKVKVKGKLSHCKPELALKAPGG
jgi:hypothetical protein